MVFRELLRTCPEQRSSSVDGRREWFLGKLTAESPEKVLAYLRPLAIASKLRPVHTVLTEENWRSLMVMVDPAGRLSLTSDSPHRQRREAGDERNGEPKFLKQRRVPEIDALPLAVP